MFTLADHSLRLPLVTPVPLFLSREPSPYRGLLDETNLAWFETKSWHLLYRLHQAHLTQRANTLPDEDYGHVLSET